MVSSAKRDCPTMGHAGGVGVDVGADAVGEADIIGELLRCRRKVEHGEAVGVEALVGFFPGCGDGDHLEADVARIPAECAEGLTCEGVAQARFGDGDHLHDVVVDGRIDFPSQHGFATVGDHDDQQRPEAQEDAQQGRDVTQEPEGPGPTVHGRDYTAARTPAGFEKANPTNFRAKCLKSGRI
jgi:hypothetical protein